MWQPPALHESSMIIYNQHHCKNQFQELGMTIQQDFLKSTHKVAGNRFYISDYQPCKSMFSTQSKNVTENPQHIISGFNIQVIPIYKQINSITNMKTTSNLAQLYSNRLDCSKMALVLHIVKMILKHSDCVSLKYCRIMTDFVSFV